MACNMYAYADMLHGGERSALRGEAENVTVSGWGVDPRKRPLLFRWFVVVLRACFFGRVSE